MYNVFVKVTPADGSGISHVNMSRVQAMETGKKRQTILWMNIPDETGGPLCIHVLERPEELIAQLDRITRNEAHPALKETVDS